MFKLSALMLGTFLVSSLASSGTLAQSDPLLPDNMSGGNDGPFRYAIYSSAWSVSSNAGLRIMAQNRSQSEITLNSVVFINDPGEDGDNILLELELTLPADGWAETQLPYMNLFPGNQCVRKTLNEDWRLVEISNYTLNPSVRGLIIEDTQSFRIFQCVRPVRTTWTDSRQNVHEENQWVMYHFERIPLDQ